MLAEEPYRDAPIVALEPSCLAVFLDESRNLSPERSLAQALAERTTLFDTFLQPHFERGDLPSLDGRALVQVHCHQQSICGRESAAAAFTAAGIDAEILDAGCCGMAGSFGFDKRHYAVSMDIGERVLLPRLRQAADSTAIIANGFSCREQIRHGTNREAQHLAELLSQAIGGV